MEKKKPQGLIPLEDARARRNLTDSKHPHILTSLHPYLLSLTFTPPSYRLNDFFILFKYDGNLLSKIPQQEGL